MANFSTGVYNGAFNATGLKEMFTNGVIEIRTGAMPANADNAVTGTLLGTVTLASGAFTPGAATNGINFDAPVLRVLSKAAAETWSFDAIATGTAGWARFKGNGVDAGGASTTLPRIDMSIGVSSGDMRLATVALVSGAPNVIQSCTITGSTP
jgi:hypothetical protein